MKTVRWGIIGCGDVTEVKSGPALQRVSGSALTAVMRRTPGKAEDYARRHGVPKWYDRAEALIADPEVDAVYVATPPSTHLLYARMAAEAGKPVYVEKPMALNAAECRLMIEACARAGVPLFVAYYRRALDRFLKIRDLVREGAIGEVRYVRVELTRPAGLGLGAPDQEGLPWRVRPEIAGGGLFVDLASHMLDFLDFVLGPVAEVWGVASRQAGGYPAEDAVSAAWRFESGVQGIGVWNFCAGAERDETVIVGDRGQIGYSTFDARPVKLTRQEGTEEFSIPYPPHIQQPLIELLVGALNGVAQSPSTGESGLRTTWVMDRILEGRRRSSS